MADITMCSQVLCPNAKSCYRVQAKPSHQWQSYAAFQYTVSTRGVECGGYLPMFESIVTDNTATNDNVDEIHGR